MTSRHFLAPACCLAALLLCPSPAHAEVGGRVDADLDLGAPMGPEDLAVGVGGRFGWRFNLGPVWLQPEAGGHYFAFVHLNCPDDVCSQSKGRHATRVLGGARIGGAGLISKVIEPSLFGHAGYGWLTSKDAGPAFDVGFALDFNVVRYFRFGAHGAYNVVAAQSYSQFSTPGGGGLPIGDPISVIFSSAEKWISFGLHVGAAF